VNTCDRAPDLGVYVLGALDPAERGLVERHLATCADCRAELAELAGLPGLLGRIDLAEAEKITASGPATSTVAASDGGLDRLLTEVAARRHRQHRRVQLLSAAAGLVILLGAGGSAVAVWGTGSHHPASITASAGPIHAKVELKSSSAGTAIDLQLTGVQPEERCSLVAIGKDGTLSAAGTWTASYRGVAGVWGVTSLAVNDIASLRVANAAGATLVTIPIAQAG
jgi:hypothetical protein